MAPISVGLLTGVSDLIPAQTGTPAELRHPLIENLYSLEKFVVGGFGALAFRP